MPSREQIEAPAPRVRYLELLQRAVAYIDSHLAEPLTADRLAEQAAMSRHHFHRIFRAYFGTTVAGYVTWRRLQRACELLAADGAPVRGVPQPPPAGVQPELGSGPALGLHGAPVCGVPPPPSARSQPELGGGPALGLRPASVLDVALAVGYDSSQALAKAMRRELDTTPTAVRAGAQPDWKRLFDRRPGAATNGEDTMLKPQMTDCPELHVLTTTGRGMQGGNMQSAADQGFGELMPAVQRAGLMPRFKSCLALFPDEPQGKDDPDARMLCGAVFDYSLHERSGRSTQPEIALGGTLAWLHQPAGRYAVFTHIGPYSGLHETWTAIYRDWLPATGYALRDVPPFELYVNDPSTTPPEQLRTDIYLPLQ